MRVKLLLEVSTEVNSLHRPWHLKLSDLSKLPRVRVPLSGQQVQAALRVGNGRVKGDELFRLVYLYVEFFVVKEEHVLHDI